ncbi:programmed cell death protein 2 [Anabrus simplex]|uniref:programmed cell death protein 2 n=1 Tax=Anabrus simplex TaxID=316456 RepID=UPI0034DD99BA
MASTEGNARVSAIGYLEEAVSWKLESRFFPSKVGGKPAWLDLLNLPSNDDLKCPKCRNPCMFLCQVYAPLDELDFCFHRTIFIFLCVDPDCCEENENRTFKVFRCQFGRKNDFYPYDPPIDDESWRPDLKAEKYHKLCIVCGAKGTSHCGRCKKVFYCSRQHQIVDWKTGHKEICQTGQVPTEAKSMRCLWLLPEFELLTAREDEDGSEETVSDETSDDEDDNDNEEARLEEFRNLVQRGQAGTFQDNPAVDQDLLQMANENEDKEFFKFRSKVVKFPQQVLRYERGGEPLWLASSNIPSSGDIPPCQYCGSPRDYELQILPQMLNHLALDGVGKSVDWGVLVVYTCRKSCNDEGPAYKEEFIWKQDIQQRNTVSVNNNPTTKNCNNN